MASFDESLYTNVPLTETLDIITKIVLPNEAQSFLGLNRVSFTKLLDIATKNCFFLFDKKLYRQCEGLSMGLPHSPVFAIIFLAFHEEQWLTNCAAHFKTCYIVDMSTTRLFCSLTSHMHLCFLII